MSDENKEQWHSEIKLYFVEENSLNLPSIKLMPSSFVEFLKEHRPKFVMGWSNGCFGVVHSGILYWTCVAGLDLSLKSLNEFYKIAGRYMDSISGKNLNPLKELLKSFGAENLEELKKLREYIDYGLSKNIISINVDGRSVDSWDELWDNILNSEIDDYDITLSTAFSKIKECFKGGFRTRDECLLWSRYGFTIDDYLTLLSINDEIKEHFGDVELYEEPKIEDGRVLIGRKGFEDVYLESIFPVLERYGSRIHEFLELYRRGEVRNYDEFLLKTEKKYSLDSFSDLVSQGLVSVKVNNVEHKIKSYSTDGGKIVLSDSEGREYLLREVIKNKTIRMPPELNYKRYLSQKNRYSYYVVWKMRDNVKHNDDRAPRDLDELRKFIKLNLISVNGKVVKDLIVEGNELYFLLEDGSKVEMYHFVAPQNRFEIFGAINGNLRWIRRFIAEGYRDKSALKLALTLKKYEISKRKNYVSIHDLSRETGIPEAQLEIYLRSDLFKRFGELNKGNFYIHPDITEFKRSVKVRDDEDYEVIVVDGRNVMYGGEEKDNKKGKVERLKAVYEYLLKQGVPENRIIIIVKDSDFNSHRIDDVEALRELERKGIVRSVSNHEYDDKIILEIALEERNGLIISNDNYGEFVGDNISKDALERRIMKYTFRGKNFHIKREHRSKLESFIEKMKALEEGVEDKDREIGKVKQ